MATKITENHRIVTYEHEMNAEDHRLTEKKQKTVIENKSVEDPEGSDANMTTILVHVRRVMVQGEPIAVEMIGLICEWNKGYYFEKHVRYSAHTMEKEPMFQINLKL